MRGRASGLRAISRAATWPMPRSDRLPASARIVSASESSPNCGRVSDRASVAATSTPRNAPRTRPPIWMPVASVSRRRDTATVVARMRAACQTYNRPGLGHGLRAEQLLAGADVGARAQRRDAEPARVGRRRARRARPRGAVRPVSRAGRRQPARAPRPARPRAARASRPGGLRAASPPAARRRVLRRPDGAVRAGHDPRRPPARPVHLGRASPRRERRAPRRARPPRRARVPEPGDPGRARACAVADANPSQDRPPAVGARPRLAALPPRRRRERRRQRGQIQPRPGDADAGPRPDRRAGRRLRPRPTPARDAQ